MIQVIVKEGQTLTEGQETLLQNTLSDYEYLVYPKKGWKQEEIEDMLSHFCAKEIPIILAFENSFIAKAMGFGEAWGVENGIDWRPKILYSENQEQDADWQLV